MHYNGPSPQKANQARIMDTKIKLSSNPDFNPFASEEVPPAHSEEWTAKRRIAKALRELSSQLITSAEDSPELIAFAESVEAVIEARPDFPRLEGILAFAETGKFGGWGELSHEINALGGQANPLSPEFSIWFVDGRAFGKTRFGWLYEGPPGHVHGGYVAAIFDQFMGMAQIIGGNPGRTGHLNTRYHSPTPLNVDLRLYGDIIKQEGRKTVITATLYAGETLTASSEALFITPRDGHILPMSGGGH
ncbi:MAG: hypothetical protein ACI9GW_003373 [Halieaceae bacterium]|jgi:hypothetical protein